MREWIRKPFIAAAGPLIIMICSPLLLFHEVLYAGKSLYGSDVVLQFYAWKGFAYEHLWTHGSLPFWNPYLFSGSPFITNIQASMFYPLGFFYYLLPPEQAYVYSTIMHCVLGSLFMYLFMRGMFISPAASCFSGIVFTFNGYFLAHIYAGHLSFVQNYIWIPLLFLFLHKFMDNRNMGYAMGAGLTLGVQILGGFPQIAFYTILASLTFFVPSFVTEAKRRAYRRAFRLGVGLSLTLLIGFALAAVQVLPTLEFTRLSTRATGVSYLFATLDSLHPKELLAFLLPEIFGNPTNGTYWLSIGPWHFWETCGYVGILPIVLIFVKAERRQPAFHRAFFVLLMIVSLALALGKHNPLYPLIYQLPGFGSFRIPAQIIFLCVFSAAILAGFGMEGILSADWRFVRLFWIFLIIAGGVTSLLLIGLWFYRYQIFLFLFKNFAEGSVSHVDLAATYHNTVFSLYKAFLLLLCCPLLVLLRKWKRVGKGIFVVLAFGVLALDLYLFCKGFIKPHDYNLSREKQEIIAQLYNNPAEGRVVTIGDVFRANDGLTGRFPSILGYDPLILKRYARYIQASQRAQWSDHLVNLEDIDLAHSKLLKNLNLRQILLNSDLVPFENEVPYANVIYDVVVKSHEEALSLMKSDDFDVRRKLVLESDWENLLLSEGANKSLSSACTVLCYENERICIKASASRAGYLVLSEVYYPGWQATVDGKEVPIRLGNFLFRAIPLEAGEHEVELRFVSWPFRVGGLISLVTLVSATGGLWLLRRRRHETPV